MLCTSTYVVPERSAPTSGSLEKGRPPFGSAPVPLVLELETSQPSRHSLDTTLLTHYSPIQPATGADAIAESPVHVRNISEFPP